jgi:putative acetyltransferase
VDPLIRIPRRGERGALLALWERSVRATHDFLADGEIELLRPLVQEMLASDAFELWVLVDQSDVPIGFMGLAGDAIEALFLDPAHRGQGGGRRLVAHAQALRGGALTVDVNEQNRAAHRFYETLGFVVVDRSPVDGAGRPYPLLHLRRAAGATLAAR